MDARRVYFPKVIIDERALEWIRAIVDQHDTEVGFFACVDKIGDDNTFFIRNVEYPRQDLVTGATCEMDRGSQAELMRKLIAENREGDLSKMKVWGHSHVNMGVGPSAQDHEQAMKFSEEHCEGTFMIRLITNKRREMGVALYDYQNNMIIEDVDIKVSRSNPEIVAREKIDRITNIITTSTPEAAINLIKDVLSDNSNTFYREAVAYIVANKPQFIPKSTVVQGNLFSEKNGSALQEAVAEYLQGKKTDYDAFGSTGAEDDENTRRFRSQLLQEVGFY